MTLPTITAPPTPPSRGDAPAEFNAAADRFLGSFSLLAAEINAFGLALPATVLGIDFTGTSTTSIAIGTGSKAFATQSGKNWYIGQPVRISNTTTPSNYMDGQVTAYSGTTLTVSVTAVGGSGTLAAWTIGPTPGAGSFATLVGAETLTNKTLTTPVLSGTASGTAAGRLGYAAGVLTFGDGSAQRTVVTTDNTQTLTNKTYDAFATGNVFKFNGNAFSCAAGTATITMPNVSDTIVLRGTTDTLTNKTLTAPVITSPTISGGSMSGVNGQCLPGAIMDYAMSTAPTGWLECDGTAVSRATYAALFSAIGTAWGSGDGSTTFNLPDFRGEFRRGWDHGRGVDSARAFASAQSDDLKAHTHTVPEGAVSPGGGSQYSSGDDLTNTKVTDSTSGSTGGTETRPRNIAVLTCIKT